MARFDDLPADQTAVLQLVLRQGRTYGEIAGLLKISEAAVQNRALTALDAIGPANAELGDDRQDEIGDYLLGQQSASERAATREFLESDQPGRDWARGVATELRSAGVAGDDALPEIPSDPAEVDEAFDALHARRAARADQARSSRLGGMLIIVAVLLVVVGGVLVLTGVIGGSDDDGNKTASTPTQTSTVATTASVEQQINLTAPSGAKKPLGVANVVSQDGQRALAVVGQDLPASGHYVLWVRNGTKSKFLGFFPVVSGSGANKGRLQGLVAAPSDLASYKEMLVTREASSTPKQPSTIVLKGSLGG
ncbi:MAG: sigma-70 region 4 domain-containing protein [Solirubrobacterales bacterium]